MPTSSSNTPRPSSSKKGASDKTSNKGMPVSEPTLSRRPDENPTSEKPKEEK